MNSHGHGDAGASRTVSGRLATPCIHKGVLTRKDGSSHVLEDGTRGDTTFDKSCRRRDAV